MPKHTAYITILSLLFLSPFSGHTQDTNTSATTIIEHITTVDGHTIDIPDALKGRLTPQVHQHVNPTSQVANGGYRIQVFSDSNPRAHGEAKGKATNINSRFPQWKSYVTYAAPYWRLRIGDFTNYEDANDALAALKDAFPAYKRELRIVRDHINVGY